MKRAIAVLSIFLVAGCVLVPGARYSLYAFRVEGGSFVQIGCSVDQYSTTWRADAEEQAMRAIDLYFAEHSENREATAILRTSLSEGGWAGVLAVAGTNRFVADWKAKGDREAGMLISRLWAERNGPDHHVSGRLPQKKPNQMPEPTSGLAPGGGSS